MTNARNASAARIAAVAAVVALAVIATVIAGLGTIPVVRADEPADSPPVRLPASPTAWIGIVFASGSPAPAKSEGDASVVAPPAGVKVDGVFEGGPAESAGLRAGDRILSIDGMPVGAPAELLA